jgi:hypothetical protein
MSGAAVLLPRRVLERALADPQARRTVRNVLHAAVTVLRSRRMVEAIRLELARQVGGHLRSLLAQRCIRCEAPLDPDDPVLVQAGFRGHLACPPMW